MAFTFMEEDGDSVHFLSKARKPCKDNAIQVHILIHMSNTYMALHILTHIYNTYIIILKNKLEGDKKKCLTKYPNIAFIL